MLSARRVKTRKTFYLTPLEEHARVQKKCLYITSFSSRLFVQDRLDFSINK